MQVVKWWKLPWFRRCTYALAGCVAMLAGSCWFLRIGRLADLEAYQGMVEEGHPVWKAFALRRFSAGDPVSDLLAAFPPSQKEEFGRHGLYYYHDGEAGAGLIMGAEIMAHSENGRLVRVEAASCTWSFVFFGSADSRFDAEYSAHLKKQREQALRRMK